MTSSTFSPAMMPRTRTITVPVSLTDHDPDSPADGSAPKFKVGDIIKAKHLEPGMHVKAWLTIDGTPQACGSTRTVGTKSDVSPEGTVDVSFSSLHPSETFKAARRFQIQEA